LISGIFAGTEIAVIALRGSRLDALVATGSKRARAVKRLRADPERFLATVQIGITILGAIAGAFGGATFASRLRPMLEKIPALAAHAESIALAVVVALISYLTIVLGELVPKSLALRYAEQYALLMSQPLLGLSWLARPLVWFLTASSNVVLRLFGDRTTFTEARLSSEELQQLVEGAARTGSVNPLAGEIASRALDFAELTVAHVMVPRGQIIALPRQASLEEIRQVVRERGHTRMPVFEGGIERVIGYVNVKDLVAGAWQPRPFTLDAVVRPAHFVTAAMRVVDLLEEMKRQRNQIAVVVDDAGMTTGLVTLEDLVEELVGDVFSEHEKPGAALLREEPDGSFLVQGEAPVRDVNRALDLDLPERAGWSTIAGLCLSLAGRIPRAGERLTAPDGTTLTIADSSERQVRSVRLRKAALPPGGEPTDTKS
jgi:putative hemolysin